MGDSAILGRVNEALRTEFVREVTHSWLPRQQFTLLYRGTRDGMCPRHFHRLCDDAGATITLVQSHNACVFGGYNSSSWKSSRRPGVHISKHRCDDAFLFTVAGPVGVVTQFPVKDEFREAAVVCCESAGPWFGSVLPRQADLIVNDIPSSGGRWCLSALGGCYDDGGHGSKALFGDTSVLVQEMETYLVRSCV